MLVHHPISELDRTLFRVLQLLYSYSSTHASRPNADARPDGFEGGGVGGAPNEMGGRPP